MISATGDLQPQHFFGMFFPSWWQDGFSPEVHCGGIIWTQGLLSASGNGGTRV